MAKQSVGIYRCVLVYVGPTYVSVSYARIYVCMLAYVCVYVCLCMYMYLYVCVYFSIVCLFGCMCI